MAVKRSMIRYLAGIAALVALCAARGAFAEEMLLRQWVVQFGTPKDDVATALAADSFGNIYAAGYTDDWIDGNMGPGGRDIFVAKYDPSGNKQWTRQFGTPASDEAFAIAVDANDNVYIAGYTDGAFEGEQSMGSRDAFVMKLNAAGKTAWVRQFGTLKIDEAHGISIDPTGDIVIAGSTWDAFDECVSAGMADLFLAKFDPTGDRYWVRQMGTAYSDEAFGVATDTSGCMYVTGYTQGAFYGNKSSGAWDAFVMRFDDSGTALWIHQFGTGDIDIGRCVAIDRSGSCIVAGQTGGKLDGNRYAGNGDAFLTKFDADGARAWTRVLGSAQRDDAFGVVTGYFNDIYLAGCTQGSIDSAVNHGMSDSFLAKFDALGNRYWLRQEGTPWRDETFAIAADQHGNVYTAGCTSGSFGDMPNKGGSDVCVMRWRSNINPILSWAREMHCDQGVVPDAGDAGAIYKYFIRYIDENNDEPKTGYPRVHVKKNGREIKDSPFVMSELDTYDKNYADGKIYTVALPLDAGEYVYSFEAFDKYDLRATGMPVSERPGPSVISDKGVNGD